MDRSRTWLVTGGAGFIGVNFVKHILASQPDVELVIVDKLTYAGNLQSLKLELELPRCHFVKGDIVDSDLVAKIFAQFAIDTVVHFAAESHVDRSILGPDEFIRTNVQGTLNLLEQAKQSWQQDYSDKLFLHVSTDEVFGSLSLEAPAFTEQHPYRPNSPYAASKASSDHLVRAWHQTYDLPCIITNCSNNYGPWQFPEKLIPLLIRNILLREPLPVYGDGLQRRDWLHVSDHCRAIEFIIEHGQVGESYCIGGNNECTNLSIVEKICELIDARVAQCVDSKKLIQFVTDRLGHDRRYAINADKLKQLGWQPQAGFDHALAETVEWYLANQAWVEDIISGDYQLFYQQQYQLRLEQN